MTVLPVDYQISLHGFNLILQTISSEHPVLSIDVLRDDAHFESNAHPQPGNSASEHSIRSLLPLPPLFRSVRIFVWAQPVCRREQTPTAGYALGSWSCRQW